MGAQFGALPVATPRKIPSKTGKGSYVIQVRVKPYDRCQKTFPIITTADAAKKLAIAWAKAEKKRLLELREKGQSAVQDNISTLTVGKLINTYLADPEVTGLKTFTRTSIGS